MPRILTKSSENLRLSVPVEVKLASSGNAGRVEGYASAFGGSPDSYGDVIEKGAFSRTVSDHSRGGTMPAMLWAHDHSRPIGRWTDMHEDEFGLHMVGELNLDTTGGKDAHGHLKNGDVNGLSIGYLVPPGGARKQGSSRILTDIDLVEVSVVTFPANGRSRVNGVKTLQNKSDLVDLLRDGGLSKAAAARIAAGGWSAFSQSDFSEKANALAAQIDAATAKFRSL